MKTKTSVLIAGMLLASLTSTLAQPIITHQPQNQTNIAGTTAMFTVGATGAPPLSFQWRSYAGATVFTNIPWGTDATLLLTNVQPTTRRFSVVVSNAEGAVTSVLATLTILVPPTITNQPTSQTVEVGESATFSVGATGTAPFRYQWWQNDANLAGRTNASLVLTNLQPTNGGSYTVEVTNVAGSTNSQVATLTVAPPVFTKITNGPIVEDLAGSIRGAWGDYDDDGYLDLFVTSPAANKNHLYHNERNGTFSRITTGDIVNTARDWRAGVWADYDNDGHLDLYVTSNSAYGGVPPFNDLYRNNGDGTFTTMSSNVVGPIVGPNGDSETCAWADYNRDGFLDLFISRYGNDLLFRNQGDGSYIRITNSVLVQDGTNNYGCAWADYDNDGWPDLFTSAANSGGNFLYHNNGDGSFERITSGPGQDAPSFGLGMAWVDYNNDGFLDLFVTNGDGPDLLYRNQGDGTFTKIITGELVRNFGTLHKCAWGDYDNDGYLDVFLATRYGQDNLLYRNNGDSTFTRITNGSLVHDGGNSVNASWADYDNDGFLDLFVANGAADAPQNNFLYRNNGNTNHWLKVRLIGTVSNRSAIGAKVRLKATIRGREMWQLREMFVNDGNTAGSGLIAHFGLGDASQVDLVKIKWPDGTVQQFHDVLANQFLTIIEPPRLQLTGMPPNGGARFTLRCGPGFTYALETSPDLLTWMPISTNTAAGLWLQFQDAEAADYRSRFYRVKQLP